MSDDDSDDSKSSRPSAKRKRRDSVSSSSGASSKRHKRGHSSSSSSKKTKHAKSSKSTKKNGSSPVNGRKASKQPKEKSKKKSFRGGGNSKESKHSGGGSSSRNGKSKKDQDDEDDLSVAEEEDDYELNDDFSMSRLGIPNLSATVFDNSIGISQPLPFPHSPPPLDTGNYRGLDSGNSSQYDADTAMRETVNFAAGLDLPISTTALQQPASVLSWCNPASNGSNANGKNPSGNTITSIHSATASTVATADTTTMDQNKSSHGKSQPILANSSTPPVAMPIASTTPSAPNGQQSTDTLLKSSAQVQQQRPTNTTSPICVQALTTNTSTRMGQGGGRSTDIVPTSIFSGNWPAPHPDDLRCFACERSDYIENLKKSDEAITLANCYAAYGTMDDLELCRTISTYYDKTYRAYQPGQFRWTERGVLTHLSEHMFNVDAMLKVATRMCFRSVLDLGKNGMRVLDTSTGEIFCNAKGLGTFDKAAKLLQSLAKANSK